jgi:Trk-type K+ transport system membrane component
MTEVGTLVLVNSWRTTTPLGRSGELNTTPSGWEDAVQSHWNFSVANGGRITSTGSGITVFTSAVSVFGIKNSFETLLPGG